MAVMQSALISLWNVDNTVLHKSPTFLGNYCKGVKIYHFSSEIILGIFYRHLAIFFWSLCQEGPLSSVPQSLPRPVVGRWNWMLRWELVRTLSALDNCNLSAPRSVNSLGTRVGSVWPDWAIFKHSLCQISFKSSPNVLWLLGLFWKVKTAVDTFWPNIEKLWATFYFKIWSNWMDTT